MSMSLSLSSVSPKLREAAVGNALKRLALRASGQIGVASLDKSWHGLHWLIARTSGEALLPLGFLLSGGEEFGEDWGYGPPRWLEPEVVAQIATALSGLSDEEAASRYDGPAMTRAGLYGGHWDAVEEERQYLIHYLQILRTFMQRAADGGRGVVVLLS